MTKTNTPEKEEMIEDDNFEVSLDNQFILSRHKIVVDNGLKSLDSSESTKKYAKQAMRRIMHDDVEVSSIKLKRPGFIKKGIFKLIRKPVKATLYVTTKF
jgi:hypothetical protein